MPSAPPAEGIFQSALPNHKGTPMKTLTIRHGGTKLYKAIQALTTKPLDDEIIQDIHNLQISILPNGSLHIQGWNPEYIVDLATRLH